MADIIRGMNLVVYLTAKSLQKGKHEDHFAGAHGYSYTIANEGKKKLAKDVATTSGYYTSNNQKANTVVVVDDIMSLVAPNAGTYLRAILMSFEAVLGLFNSEESLFKNLCLITPHKELQEVFKLNKANVKENMRLGRHDVTKSDVEALLKTLDAVEKFKALGDSKVIFDFPGSAEGGAGNKLAFKQTELAEVITTFGNDKDVELELTPRKEFENPESDFNKIVTGSRWFFDSLNVEAYYAIHHGYRKYCFGRVEPDKNYYGKITPDVTYSAVYTKEPIVLLDKLFEFTTRKVDNPEGYLVAGDLNHLTSKEVARMINKHPAIREGNNLVSPVTKGNGKPILIELIKPVLMSYRIRDEMNNIDIILDSFKARDESNVYKHSTFYDITDMVYTKEENKKGDIKVKLNVDFNSLKSVFKVMVAHPNAVKPVAILLSVGYDIPERNAFNSVDDPEVKVWVVTDTRNPKGVRYCTLVETSEFVYILMSAAANLKVLSIAEQGKK